MELDDIITSEVERRRALGFVPALLARDILNSAPTAAVNAWFRAHALTLLTATISDRLRFERLQQAPRSRTEEAIAHRAEVGTSWLESMYSVDDQNTRRRLADMTGKDLRYAAADRAQQAAALTFEEHFLLALAKRVGSKKCSEVFTEEQIEAMRQRLAA